METETLIFGTSISVFIYAAGFFLVWAGCAIADSITAKDNSDVVMSVATTFFLGIFWPLTTIGLCVYGLCLLARKYHGKQEVE